MSEQIIEKINRAKKIRKSLIEFDELPSHLCKILVETKKKYGYSEDDCYRKWIKDYDRVIKEC